MEASLYFGNIAQFVSTAKNVPLTDGIASKKGNKKRTEGSTTRIPFSAFFSVATNSCRNPSLLNSTSAKLLPKLKRQS